MNTALGSMVADAGHHNTLLDVGSTPTPTPNGKGSPLKRPKTKHQNNMSTDKVYIGSGRIIKTKMGELPKISLSSTDLDTLRQHLNERGWVNLVMKAKKTPVEGKPTHYLEVDMWKAGEGITAETNTSDDLPF